MKTIPAGKFRAQCLALLDEVARTGEELVVTKRGKPVARVGPLSKKDTETENPLKNSIVFEGDLITPISVDWEADR